MTIPLAVVLGAAVALTAAQELRAPDERGRFHHLHISTSTPAGTIEFYDRLFPPAATRDARRFAEFGASAGLEGDGVLLLVSNERSVRTAPPGGGLWHFGWGPTSVGESYRSHLVNEVRWERPIPSLTWHWHVHVLSRTPRETADWFRRAFGGEIEASSPGPELEPYVTAAIVRWPRMSLAIHQWDGSDPGSEPGAQRIDHLAFAVGDVAATVDRLRAMRAEVVSYRNGVTGTSTDPLVRSPDGVVVEVVADDWRSRH